MAEEANVENLLTNRGKYYCHKCQVELRYLLPGYQCPTCQYGFVELMEQPEANEESDSSFSDVDDFSHVDMLNSLLQDFPADDRPVSGRGRGSRRLRDRMEPVENILQDLLLNLTGLGWAGQWATQGQLQMNNLPAGGTIRNAAGGPVLFLGNPGDYAWSREGLDAIVTQLLNQMDGTGPPPLAKDKIQKIPIAVITQDQVDANLQCSVCWEDFRVAEQVRKLWCEHVYHGPCITPWLELHGTCPICRKTMSGGEGGGGGGLPAATAGGGNATDSSDPAQQLPIANALGPLESFFRRLQDTQGRNLSSPATSSPSSSSSSSSSSASSSTLTGSSSSMSTSSNSSADRVDMNWTMEYE